MRNAETGTSAHFTFRNPSVCDAILRFSHFRIFAFSHFAFLMICHSCKGEMKFEGPISRTEVCPACDADVHCCLNCLNYEPSAHNRCREPQTEWVSDREKGNFCDFFLPSKRPVLGTAKPADDIRRTFESLFKK